MAEIPPDTSSVNSPARTASAEPAGAVKRPNRAVTSGLGGPAERDVVNTIQPVRRRVRAVAPEAIAPQPKDAAKANATPTGAPSAAALKSDENAVPDAVRDRFT